MVNSIGPSAYGVVLQSLMVKRSRIPLVKMAIAPGAGIRQVQTTAMNPERAGIVLITCMMRPTIGRFVLRAVLSRKNRRSMIWTRTARAGADMIEMLL